MSEEIHGHAVMDMMMESSASYTKETLRLAIDARFGPNARFRTCSAEHMTAVELIEFLEARGKFAARTDGFTIERDRMCAH